MLLVGAASLDLARSSGSEALLGALVGLHLRHGSVLTGGSLLIGARTVRRDNCGRASTVECDMGALLVTTRLASSRLALLPVRLRLRRPGRSGPLRRRLRLLLQHVALAYEPS